MFCIIAQYMNMYMHTWGRLFLGTKFRLLPGASSEYYSPNPLFIQSFIHCKVEVTTVTLGPVYSDMPHMYGYPCIGRLLLLMDSGIESESIMVRSGISCSTSMKHCPILEGTRVKLLIHRHRPKRYCNDFVFTVS